MPTTTLPATSSAPYTRPTAANWLDFLRIFCGLAGVLLLLAAVVCFFAWNWNGMSRFLRMAIPAILVVGGAGVALWRGLDTTIGNLALLFAGLCIGPFWAVFGQTYQMGGELWMLLLVWACFLGLLAIAGRQMGLWCATWLVGTISLHTKYYTDTINMAWSLPPYQTFWLPLVLMGLALALWEAVACRTNRPPKGQWMQARWFPRLMGFVYLTFLTTACLLAIFEPHARFGYRMYGLLCATLVAGWLWYRWKRQDLLMLCLGLVSLATVLFCIVLNGSFGVLFSSNYLFGILMLTCIFLGLFFAVVKCMYALRLALAAGQAPGNKTWGAATPETETPQAEPLPPLSSSASTPWYIKAFTIGGAWIAAILVLCLVLASFFITLLNDAEATGALIITGAGFLFASWLVQKKDSLFFREMTLVWALAGTIGLVTGVVMSINADFPLAQTIAVTCCLCLPVVYVAINDSRFRLLAAIAFLYNTGLLVYFLIAPGSIGPDGFRLQHISFANAFFALALSLLAVFIWKMEARWDSNPGYRGMVRPLANATLPALLFLALVWPPPGPFTFLGYSSEFYPLPPALYGFAAFAGILALVVAAWHDHPRRSLLPLIHCLLGACFALAPAMWFFSFSPALLFAIFVYRYSNEKWAMSGVIGLLSSYYFLYYYSLETSLATKALEFAVTGGMALALAFVLRATQRYYSKRGTS